MFAGICDDMAVQLGQWQKCNRVHCAQHARYKSVPAILHVHHTQQNAWQHFAALHCILYGAHQVFIVCTAHTKLPDWGGKQWSKQTLERGMRYHTGPLKEQCDDIGVCMRQQPQLMCLWSAGLGRRVVVPAK